MMVELQRGKTLHETALDRFEQAADGMELPAGIRSSLAAMEDVLQDRVSIALRDGRTEYVDAWVVRHNTSRGPAMGGICYHSDLTLDELKAKAMFMTWRWAVLGIPCGGGKGGVAAGLNRLQQAAAERLARHTLEIVPAAALQFGRGAAATGPIPSQDASARSVFYSAQAACERLKLNVAGSSVVVHGFGETGSGAAELLGRAGARVVAVGDSRGAIFRENGLDIPGVVRHKRREGSVVGFHGAQPITDCELFELDCDILVASAIEGTIRSRNAPAIRARIVAEATDGSITQKADSILEEGGVFVIPDLIANAGRDAAAYYESVHEPDVYGRLQRDLRGSFDELGTVATARRVSMRKAAYLLAVGRVAGALKSRGGKELNFHD